MKKVIALGLALAPSFAFAAITDVNSILGFAMSLLNSATVLIMAAAVVWFLIGVFQFIRAGGDAAGKSEGRNKIIYGIVGLAVMASVYGLVNILVNTIGPDNRQITPPSLPILPR